MGLRYSDIPGDELFHIVDGIHIKNGDIHKVSLSLAG